MHIVSIDLARLRIHEHRVRLGLSPEQYGLRVGVSGMTVRRVEKGYTPFLSTQQKFAAAMGVSHTDLFGMPDLPTHYLEQRMHDTLEAQQKFRSVARPKSQVAL